MSKKKKTLKDILDGFFRNDPDISENLNNLLGDKNIINNKTNKNISEGETEDGDKWRSESWRDDNGAYHQTTIITTSFDGDIDDFAEDLENYFKEKEEEFPDLFKSKKTTRITKRTPEDTQKDTLGILNRRLNSAVNEERFEDAAKLRDMIKNLKENKNGSE